MPLNYEFSYIDKGKHIYVPNADSVSHGKTLLRFCSENIEFPPYFYHYTSGGHVAALHHHLPATYFFRIDIQNFYYSISRNRVAAALHRVGFRRARNFAKWSCVKNPLPGPRYSLPIGFVQSPILASLVIAQSPLAKTIEKATARGVHVSVYFDDFIGSSSDHSALEASYAEILTACERSNFTPNPEKLSPPAHEIVAFNCSLRHGAAHVTEARKEKFYRQEPEASAEAAFEAYCARVEAANA